MLSFKIIDGYISGATVFADFTSSGTVGSWDAGEPKGTTDASGSVTIEDPGVPFTVVAFGGVNVDTGKAFTATLTAPSDATSVTPLTTLVSELIAAGLSSDAAVAKIQTAFGLNAGDDILTLDPIATNNTAVAKAGVQVAALLEGSGGGEAGEAVAEALAAAVNVSTGVVDVTDATVLQAIIETAQTDNPTLTALTAVDSGSVASSAAAKNATVASANSVSEIQEVEGATFTVLETDGVVSYGGSAEGGIIVAIDASGVASFTRSGVTASETIADALTKQFSGTDLTFSVTDVATSGNDELIFHAPDAISVKFAGSGQGGSDRYVVKIDDPDTGSVVSDDASVDVRYLTLDTRTLDLGSDDLVVFDFAGKEDFLYLNAASNISNVSQIEVMKGTVDVRDIDVPVGTALIVNSGFAGTAAQFNNLSSVTSVSGAGEVKITVASAADLTALTTAINDTAADTKTILVGAKLQIIVGVDTYQLNTAGALVTVTGSTEASVTATADLSGVAGVTAADLVTALGAFENKSYPSIPELTQMVADLQAAIEGSGLTSGDYDTLVEIQTALVALNGSGAGSVADDISTALGSLPTYDSTTNTFANTGETGAGSGVYQAVADAIDQLDTSLTTLVGTITDSSRCQLNGWCGA